MTPTAILVTNLAALLLALGVLVPLVTLAHELGHALTSLLLGGGAAEVRVGRAGGPGMRLGPLRLTFSPLPGPDGPFRGRCVRRGVIRSAKTELAVVLAGPAATALCVTGLAGAALSLRGGPPLLAFTLGYGAALALVALVTTFDVARVRPVWRVCRRGGVLPREAPDLGAPAASERLGVAR